MLNLILSGICSCGLLTTGILLLTVIFDNSKKSYYQNFTSKNFLVEDTLCENGSLRGTLVPTFLNNETSISYPESFNTEENCEDKILEVLNNNSLPTNLTLYENEYRIYFKIPEFNSTTFYAFGTLLIVFSFFLFLIFFAESSIHISDCIYYNNISSNNIINNTSSNNIINNTSSNNIINNGEIKFYLVKEVNNNFVKIVKCLKNNDTCNFYFESNVKIPYGIGGKYLSKNIIDNINNFKDLKLISLKRNGNRLSYSLSNYELSDLPENINIVNPLIKKIKKVSFLEHL